MKIEHNVLFGENAMGIFVPIAEPDSSFNKILEHTVSLPKFISKEKYINNYQKIKEIFFYNGGEPDQKFWNQKIFERLLILSSEQLFMAIQLLSLKTVKSDFFRNLKSTIKKWIDSESLDIPFSLKQERAFLSNPTYGSLYRQRRSSFQSSMTVPKALA